MRVHQNNSKCLKIWLTQWWVDWICTCYLFGYVLCMPFYVISVLICRKADKHTIHLIQNLVWNLIYRLKVYCVENCPFSVKKCRVNLAPIFWVATDSPITTFVEIWFKTTIKFPNKPSLSIQVSWILCIY